MVLDVNSDLSEELNLNDDYLDQPRESTLIQRIFSPIKAGSLRGNLLTMVSLNFGTFSLCLPNAFVNVGLIPALIMILISFMTSYWTMYILIFTARKQKILNYSLLIESVLGKRMKMFSDIMNMIFIIGIMMTYQFTMSEFFVALVKIFFDYDMTRNEKLIQMAVFMAIFQIPLSLFKNISKLQYASMVGNIALIYSMIVIVIESPFYYKQGKEENRMHSLFKPIEWSILKTTSVFLYGFASHNGLLTIYSELKSPSKRRSIKVLNLSMIIQIFVFLLIALSGYFSLLEVTPQIFLSRIDLEYFKGKDYFMVVAKFLFVFCLNCNCAINYNNLRSSIKSIFFNNKIYPFKYDLIITVLIYIISNFLSFKSKDVVTIIGIISGLCVITLSFINPILLYVFTNKRDEKYNWKNILSIFLLIIIIIIGLMITVYSFIQIFI